MDRTAERPRLLDLFCGAGGAAMGYHRAGWEVVGVDIAPQPHYPFKFIQANALGVRVYNALAGGLFDAVHASPPCQFATAYRRRKGVAVDAVNLIPDTRAMLQEAALPYVIENVEQAREHLIDPVRYCGGSSPWRLDVQRHRLFESTVELAAPPCDHSWQTPRFPCATNRTNLRRTVEIGVWRIRPEVQFQAMGVDWMTIEELSQAIPPAYTEHIGRQLIEHLAGGLDDETAA